MVNDGFETESPRVRFAVEVAEAGCAVARRVQQEMVVSAIEKEDRSPVTIADFAIQALIGCRLEKAFPGEMLVGEESAELLRRPGQEGVVERIAGFIRGLEPEAGQDEVLRWIDRGQGKLADRFWVVDPIDGTKGFLRDAQYAVALAYVEGREVQLGVLGCPRLELSSGRRTARPEVAETGCLVVAERGHGTWMRRLGESRFQRLQVSAVEAPPEAVALRSVESGHTNVSRFDTVLEFVGTRREPIRMDSQAKYAMLAAGQADFLLRLISPGRPDYREKIWDQAAGAIVVEEAGGRITDLDGKPLDFGVGRKLLRNRGVVASNGRLHEVVLEALRQVERDD
ncbi:MAG: 3'(2'),5'-bisphosphate nucleotidase [Acidobacteriota bacterium]